MRMFFMLDARRKSWAWLLSSHCILYSGRACSPVSELRCRVHKALQMSKCYSLCLPSWDCLILKLSMKSELNEFRFWLHWGFVGTIMVMSTYIMVEIVFISALILSATLGGWSLGWYTPWLRGKAWRGQWFQPNASHLGLWSLWFVSQLRQHSQHRTSTTPVWVPSHQPPVKLTTSAPSMLAQLQGAHTNKFTKIPQNLAVRETKAVLGFKIVLNYPSLFR